MPKWDTRKLKASERLETIYERNRKGEMYPQGQERKKLDREMEKLHREAQAEE